MNSLRFQTCISTPLPSSFSFSKNPSRNKVKFLPSACTKDRRSDANDFQQFLMNSQAILIPVGPLDLIAFQGSSSFPSSKNVKGKDEVGKVGRKDSASKLVTVCDFDGDCCSLDDIYSQEQEDVMIRN